MFKINKMAKEISGLIKLQIRGGAANPSPPVGPALGAKGVNIMEFCKQFNARTQEKLEKVLPCVITVYTDKSFDFVVKTPPAAVQLLKQLKLKKVLRNLIKLRLDQLLGIKLKLLLKTKCLI